MRQWLIAIMFAFGPLVVLELHHLRQRQRMRWSEERRALRALRAIQPPRSIP